MVQGVSAQTQEARQDICFIFLHLNSISGSSAQFPGILERKLIKLELCQGPAVCLCQPFLRYLSSCLSGTFSWVIFLLPVSLQAKKSFCFLVPLGSHQRPSPARDTSAVVSHSEILPGKQSPEPSETHQLHHFPSIILKPTSGQGIFSSLWESEGISKKFCCLDMCAFSKTMKTQRPGVEVGVCVCKNMNYQRGRKKTKHSNLFNVLAQDLIIGLRLCWI